MAGQAAATKIAACIFGTGTYGSVGPTITNLGTTTRAVINDGTSGNIAIGVGTGAAFVINGGTIVNTAIGAALS